MKSYKDKEFLNRLVSVTEARRNFGSLVSSLPEKGYIIFTRSGRPVARLTDLTKPKRKRKFGLLAYAGMFKGKSFWEKDWVGIIRKKREIGSRKTADYARI